MRMKLVLKIGLLIFAFVLATQNANATSNNINVVGGTKAKDGELPYQVWIMIETEPGSGSGKMCGGTIYDLNNIITAAHCVYNKTGQEVAPSVISVYGGSVKIHDGFKTGAKWIAPHPYYNPTNFQNDICVIRLSTPFPDGNAKIQPLPLAPFGFIPTGSCLVSGWGSTLRYGSPSSEDLLKASLPVDNRCAKDQYYFICAGGNGTNDCSGDSGGPLVCNINKRKVLTGVVSHGSQECGSTPGYFSRITTHARWIISAASSQ